MRLATIDSITTTQTLRDNLQYLMVFAATVSGDIDKINTEFNSNHSQILAQGATVDDPLNILFNAYLVVPCYHFKSYIKQKHNNFLDGILTITHKALMDFAKSHIDYLKTTGQSPGVAARRGRRRSNCVLSDLLWARTDGFLMVERRK